jgi:hypothetical protein
VFSLADVKKLFQPYALVQLYCDEVPDRFYASEIQAALRASRARLTKDAEINAEFQVEVFKTAQRPLYVILEPRLDGTIRVVSRYDEGKINSVSSFAQFLKDSLSLESAARAQVSP